MELKRAELTNQIVGAAIEVHRTLGPGLLESVYEECLCFELGQRGLAFRRELDAPLRYKGVDLQSNLRIDIFVEKSVVVELKSIAALLPIHEAQLLTYMRLLQADVGLLINLNVPILKQGIVRRVL